MLWLEGKNTLFRYCLAAFLVIAGSQHIVDSLCLTSYHRKFLEKIDSICFSFVLQVLGDWLDIHDP